MVQHLPLILRAPREVALLFQRGCTKSEAALPNAPGRLCKAAPVPVI